MTYRQRIDHIKRLRKECHKMDMTVLAHARRMYLNYYDCWEGWTTFHLWKALLPTHIKKKFGAGKIKHKAVL